jgi:hypothetical protein
MRCDGKNCSRWAINGGVKEKKGQRKTDPAHLSRGFIHLPRFFRHIVRAPMRPAKRQKKRTMIIRACPRKWVFLPVGRRYDIPAALTKRI